MICENSVLPMYTVASGQEFAGSQARQPLSIQVGDTPKMAGKPRHCYVIQPSAGIVNRTVVPGYLCN
jgi:hypothetical protein